MNNALNQIENDMNKQISDLNGMLGTCLLSDGTVSMMALEDCVAAGGKFGGVNIIVEMIQGWFR